MGGCIRYRDETCSRETILLTRGKLLIKYIVLNPVLTTSYVSVVKIFCFMLPIRSRPAHRIDNDIYNHNAAASGTSEGG